MTSTREVAIRVAKQVLGTGDLYDPRFQSCVASIDAALAQREAAVRAEERERAAKIAETHSAFDCDGPDCGAVIATAIRRDSAAEGEGR